MCPHQHHRRVSASMASYQTVGSTSWRCSRRLVWSRWLGSRSSSPRTRSPMASSSASQTAHCSHTSVLTAVLMRYHTSSVRSRSVTLGWSLRVVGSSMTPTILSPPIHMTHPSMRLSSVLVCSTPTNTGRSSSVGSPRSSISGRACPCPTPRSSPTSLASSLAGSSRRSSPYQRVR